MSMLRQKPISRLSSISVLSLALLLAGGHAVASNKIPRVVGGETATADQFPWQVALLQDRERPFDTQQCGGSIIAARWILTAAHCESTDLMTVMVGATDLNDTSAAQFIGVARWIVHPDYVGEGQAQAGEIEFDNDIALLELSEPIDFSACGNKCATISLVTEDNESATMATGTQAYVSGWGNTTPIDPEDLDPDTEFPSELQWAALYISSCVDSPAQYEPIEISNSMFCAGFSGFTKDSCVGDSGGPIVVQDESGTGYVQAGIVSWGSGCAYTGYPGVYTRLAQFQRWVWETTDGACCTDPGDTDTPDTPNSGGGGGGGGSLSWLMLFTLPALTLRRRSKARISA